MKFEPLRYAELFSFEMFFSLFLIAGLIIPAAAFVAMTGKVEHKIFLD